MSQQQQGSHHIREEAQNRSQGFDQQTLNPLHQAYLQYAFQSGPQRSAPGMQSQQQMKMGMAGPTPLGQSMPGNNNMRSMQAPQSQQSNQVRANNQLAMAAQMQAMQAMALERNIDLSLPENANLRAQLIPLMQSRIVAQQKANESNMYAQSSPVPMPSQQVTNESSPHGNSSSDVSGQSGSAKVRHTVLPGPLSASNPSLMNNPSKISMQQFSVQGRENQLPSRQPLLIGPQSSMNLNQGVDHPILAKNTLNGPETSQMQYARSLNHSAVSSSEGGMGNPFSSQSGLAPQKRQRLGFTKQQSHVLKAQILAFRRLKKGDGTLPRELLQAITPPPLETQMQQMLLPVSQDKSSGKNTQSEKDSQAVILSSGLNDSKVEVFAGDEKATSSTVNMEGTTNVVEEPPPVGPSVKEEQQTAAVCAKLEPEKTPIQSVNSVDVQVKKPVQVSNAPQAKDVGSTRKYHGPLFDSPFFTRKHDTFGSSMMMNNTSNLTLAYDVKDLLYEEGKEVISKKRAENIEKIGGLLAVNLERKRISPDLVLRLQIEEKKLRLLDLQAHLRDEVGQQQQDIMAMPDRPYRKFIRLCERQRVDLTRKVQASQKSMREKQLKSIFQWRKKLLEAHWAIRDARTARNRGVAKYHEKMLREFSKNKDDDRNKRMEALKNNDVERYREMLLEQQTSIPGDAAERYSVLSSFLSQTEEYLHKLGSKITAAKNQQEIEEVANAAAAAARAQGLSEEEVRAAAACAGEEVMIRNRFSEMNAPKDSSSVNKYYNLAHAVNERVLRQPSMLRAGTLREYQLVGLQWMLSLYNNKLNGILADEMGLGKTVQVMALIAYLMEFKGNYGPHLIIVPNAVLVNWKSELHKWLPSVSCIYYVGVKDQRAKLFSQEVCAMKFNVLVTTYEFIMYDRTKLSKIDWKYIVIDEAQRMKDRESVLARDLDRYRCQRRLLLTGTPLQNDLKELWSLLNLLLPEVFDNRKAFHDWFSKPFQKECPTRNAEDDWLEREKKVIIIHRLHQILEPFMLRRRVEDVEGSLPPKVSIILRCKMSAIQGAIYDWIKSTGTIRVDPEDDNRRIQKSSIYQTKTYKTLNNRCMELRKTCNHPLLNYPYFSDLSKDFLVRSCGKLFVLDRILVKLQRTGHRVLLFSTMTKLLDILEEYLQWRRLVYRRIDGTTSLDDRESAIMDFNSPDTDIFIFLLSIRAAGRGLNLQTADTVIIYDPDPNPKNEEQAVARAHRIGQTREVKVIYMEAVVDKIPSHQKEDEYKSGGTVDSEDDLAGEDRYMGSIEGLIRNNIQQYKIDMADEVINAGRFDQRTTHEERRLTLEAMLHDEERYQETLHDVPSLQEVNRLIARSEEEVELFDEMDEDFDWAEEMTRYDQIPKWLRVSSKEVNVTIANLSKKQSTSILSGGNVGMESSERQRGRPRGKKNPIYTTLDDENGEFSESSSGDRIGYSGHEEAEIGDLEDEEFSGAVEAPAVEKEQSEEDVPVPADRYVYPRPSESTKNNHIVEEADSSGSSSNSRKSMQMVSPSISSRKFGLLSALDSKPSSRSKRLPDEIEEGEIAMSGDSLMDVQQSGSWMQDREEGEDQHVLQPKIKRKRSIRVRPRQHTAERPEMKSSLHRVDTSSQLPCQVDHKYASQLKTDPEHKSLGEPIAYKNDQSDSSLKTRWNLSSRKMPNTAKVSASPSGTSIGGSKMPEGIQKLCKSVISKFKRRIDKEGQQIVPLLTDLWKRTENSGYVSGSGNTLLDIPKIEQHVERFEYSGVMELVSDVQFMLKSAMQCIGFSLEVRTEARKVHDLFFDILKISFPDIDFREARNALSFSSQSAPSASVPSQRQIPAGQTKYQKPFNIVEPSRNSAQNPPPRGSISTSEITRSRTPMPQRETRLTHPGELVICKKKRKEREKSGVKSGNGSAGSVSPLSRSIRSPGQGSGLGSILKDTRLSQQKAPQQHERPNRPSQQGNSAGGTLSWTNPVKKMRTDVGKRRPSHL